MPARDVLQVLRGLGRIAEQFAEVNGPEIRERAERVVQHTNAFSNRVPHVLSTTVSATPQPAEKQPAPRSTAASSVTPPSATSTKQEEVKTPVLSMQQLTTEMPIASTIVQEQVKNTATATATQPPPKAAFTASAVQAPVKPLPKTAAMEVEEPPQPPAAWKERRVPASPFSRILGFSGLAAKLAMGTAADMVRSGGQHNAREALISDNNVGRLAETLCTMRGAALKLGQMLSIQDENIVSPKLAMALDRVRQNAHVMPKAQLYKQLERELGAEWRKLFAEFDDVPIAAASIGQVHRAKLSTGERVAVKIQYPGVAESIESDLLNLKRLISYTNLLPRGLYIDEIIRVGQEELILECDYNREATQQERFEALVRQSGLDGAFVVPHVHRHLTTSRVLTTELISGVPVDKVTHLPQEERNRIARNILELTMRELFEWRFMQTDPNWSNFLYDARTQKLGLIDFGAARDYSKNFVDDYFHIVWAAANQDEAALVDYSLKMKFLTGDETAAMTRVHVLAGMVVGEPFRSNKPFDFVQSQLTKRLVDYSETFLHGRLTPPPREVYSLHRKLAGAFLMCIKLQAVVPCRNVVEDIARQYKSTQQQAASQYDHVEQQQQACAANQL